MAVIDTVDVRGRILDVTAALVLEHGVAGVAQRQIAEQVGIKAASLYHHFGSKNEIVDAVRSIVNQSLKDELDANNINYSTIAKNLETKELPDPDLIIRTSGEYRLSNFLLLQSAYAEIYISPIYWPDFNKHHFDTALKQYALRERRYGALK